MNYGHWTGCNLLQTDAGGIISPDIHLIVHKAKGTSIYLKRIHRQQHIIRFLKGTYTKNTVKKMNYGHWNGCNLLQTDADGIISPDILFIVHKAKVNSIYMQQSLPQLHMIRFQKGSASSLNWAYTAVLWSSAQPGTHTWFPEQLSAKWRRRTIPWGLKWTLMAPRERQFAPQGHKMHGFG